MINREVHWKENPVQIRLLSGAWSQATLESYNSAMKKVAKFAQGINKPRKEVITGIRSWHLFHDEPFPVENEKVVKAMLKASKLADVENAKKAKVVKQPVLLRHLGELVQELSTDSMQDQVALTIAVKIALHEAKTAKPGEIQWLHLQRLPSLFDPVGAVLRWLERAKLRSNDKRTFF